MKKVLRILSLLLAVALVFSMAACKKGDKDKDDSSDYSSEFVDASSEDETVSEGEDATDSSADATESTPSENTPSAGTPGGDTVVQQTITNPLAVDLKGATIEITTSFKEHFPTSNGTTNVSKAYAARLKQIQQKLNCKVKVTNKNLDTVMSEMTAVIASGSNYGHIVMTALFNVSGYMYGSVQNLKQVPTMDLTQDYLNAGGIVDVTSVGKSTWAVASPDMMYNYMGFLFNKRILGEIGLKDTDLYKMVDNKQWTVDKLMELAKKASKPLAGGKRQYGLILADNYTDLADNALYAVGAEMLHIKNGVISYGMEDPKVLTAYQGVYKNFYSNPDVVRNMYDEGMSTAVEKDFIEGRGLFLGAANNYVGTVSGMEDDYGFLPIPMEKGAKDYYASANWNDPVYMISANLKGNDLNNAGSFLQAVCYMGKACAEARVKDYNLRYFRDDKSAEIYSQMMKKIHITPSMYLASPRDGTLYNGTYVVMLSALRANNGKATLDTNKGPAKLRIDEINKKLSK